MRLCHKILQHTTFWCLWFYNVWFSHYFLNMGSVQVSVFILNLATVYSSPSMLFVTSSVWLPQQSCLILWSDDKVTVQALISSVLECFHAQIMMTRLVRKKYQLLFSCVCPQWEPGLWWGHSVMGNVRKEQSVMEWHYSFEIRKINEQDIRRHGYNHIVAFLKLWSAQWLSWLNARVISLLSLHISSARVLWSSASDVHFPWKKHSMIFI